MEILYTSKTPLKTVGGGMYTTGPNPNPGYELQKPSKESNVFQSLWGTISFVLFYSKGRVKKGGGGAWYNAFP